jgi:hypothetical protein
MLGMAPIGPGAISGMSTGRPERTEGRPPITIRATGAVRVRTVDFPSSTSVGGSTVTTVQGLNGPRSAAIDSEEIEAMVATTARRKKRFFTPTPEGEQSVKID